MGQLVQKKYASRSQGQFSGPGRHTSACQRPGCYGVVRTSERPLRQKGTAWWQKSADTVDSGYLYILLPRQPRQDGGDSSGNHGLAGSGAAGQKQSVHAGCRHLRCPSQYGLAVDLPVIRAIFLLTAVLRAVRRDMARFHGNSAPKNTCHMAQRFHPHHVYPLHHQALLHIFQWQETSPDTFLPGHGCQGKHTAYRFHPAVQSQLSNYHTVLQRIRPHHLKRAQYGDRNGKIIGCAALSYACRRQVYSYLFSRETKSRIFKGCPDPFLGLPYL